MEQNQIDQLMMMHGSKLSPEYIETIREHLEGIDYNQGVIACSGLKSPTTMLIISIFLGWLGMDRFMIGGVGFGAIKLVLWISGWFTCFITWIISIPWCIVDWFLIMGATRKYNTTKLMEKLAMMK